MVSPIKKALLARREDGAEIVQLVLCYPITIIFVFSIIQLSLMGYSVLSMNSACEQAAWEVDVPALAKAQQAGDDAACSNLIAETIEAVSGKTPDGDSKDILWAKSLSVEKVTQGPTANTWLYTDEPYGKSWRIDTVDNSNVMYPNGDAPDDYAHYQLSDLYQEQVDALVSYHVRYEIPTLLKIPGLSGHIVEKDIVRARVQSSRVEVR